MVRFLIEPLVRSRTLLTGLKPSASNGRLSPSKVAGTIPPPRKVSPSSSDSIPPGQRPLDVRRDSAWVLLLYFMQSYSSANLRLDVLF